MNWLLTFKAWKLVGVVVVLPVSLILAVEVGRNFYYILQTGEGPPVDENALAFVAVGLWFLAIFCLPFFWQYKVGTDLARKLANGRTYFDRIYRALVIVPAIFLFILIFLSIIEETSKDGLTELATDAETLFFLLFLLSYLFGFFFRYRQIGKTLHWIDEVSGQRPRGNALNILLCFFWWIGIWFLQPRVHAALKGLKERNLEDHFIEK